MTSTHWTNDPDAESQGARHEAETQARIDAYCAAQPPAGNGGFIPLPAWIQLNIDADEAHRRYPHLSIPQALARYDLERDLPQEQAA